MFRKFAWGLGAACASACTMAAPALAQPILLAQGTLDGAGTDLSGLSETLENGLPATMLGGTGSGLAHAGGNRFVAVSDRGPNATRYNPAVDDTVSYISRFHTIEMRLIPNPAAGGLPYLLTPILIGTRLLASPTPLAYGDGKGLGNRSDGTPIGTGAPARNGDGRYYFTGRSDNFTPGSAADPRDARFDPEAIRVANDGKSVFIADEYGPYIRQFDRATGLLLKTFALPAAFAIARPAPRGSAEKHDNPSGRIANKGMEGLAITPDGKMLVGILQQGLAQDMADKAAPKITRIVTIDIASGATREYAYGFSGGSGVSEIVAIDDHRFLVDERDDKGLGDGSEAEIKRMFIIDLKGAVDISGMNGARAAAHIVAKSPRPFVDLVAALRRIGMKKGDIPAKIEGLSFGQDVIHNGQVMHTLYIANDNDFVPGKAGPNRFYVFGFTDKDLPGFVPQQFTGGAPRG